MSVIGHSGHVVARLKRMVRATAERIFPLPGRSQAERRDVRSLPATGTVNLGDLRRLSPISRTFGFDRGLPIDRYYIEQFLARHAGDIRGRVLEIGDDFYTRKFGDGRVVVRDVLHVRQGTRYASFVGDLASADHIPSDAFDCVILTQTLHLIYDVRAALETLHRILKRDGTLLATFPGISQMSNDEWRAYWCWSFTTLSARRLFAETFPGARVAIEAHGNVLAAIAFLHGLACEELRRDELDHRDPAYEVLITVRAVKRGASP
jgi:SAM-dependent methyltransferase